MTLAELIEQNEVDIVHAENQVLRLQWEGAGETRGAAVERWLVLADAKAELRTRRLMAMMLAGVTL